MKCKKCGEELPERARFCPECGTPVEEVPAPKKLEKPLEPMGFGAVPLVPIAPPPRATRITPRVPRQYGAARAGRSTTCIPLSAYPTFKSETPEPVVEPEVAAAAEPVVEAEVREPEVAETPVEPVAEPVAEPEAQAEKNDEPEAVVEEAPEAEKDEAPEAEAAAEPEPVEPAEEPEPEPESADEPELEATQAMVFESDADSEPLPAGSEPAPAPEEPAEPELSLADRARTALGSAADRVRGILPQSNDQRALIGIVALAAVIAVAFLVYVSVGWFSPFADRSYVAPEVQPPSDGSIAPLEADDQEEEPTFSVEGGPEVRSALADYSWTELSQISALISAAESDEEGVKIASYYNLCDETGAIDAEATKPLELADGTSVPIAVAGFRHDTRSDGSGLAGISFVARGSVGSQPMNALAQTAGGWEASTLRAWVNEGLLAQLPAELADLLVAVDKTNNPVPGSGGGQTVTSDRVWLLAYSEIVGELGEGSWLYGSYQSEGAQYKIFSDLGVTWGESFPQVALSSGEYWWERSPSPNNSAWFMCVSPAGETSYGHRPATANAVIIGFCL